VDGSNGASSDRDPAYELTPTGKPLMQERMSIYSRVVLVVAIGYFPGFYLTWRGHPGLTDEVILAHVLSPWTFVLLAVHASPWLACRWTPLSPPVLRAFDLAYCTAVGLAYGQIVRSHPVPPIAPLETILAISSVLGIRALVIPSTGWRTAAAGILLCVGPTITILVDPAHFSASWLSAHTSVAFYVTWNAVAIVLTTVASAVLYGLRREVRDAQRLGQYTLVEKLGEGGMGVVYRARHALLRRPTAVKLMRTSGDELSNGAVRFEREVQLMAELTHPNTVAVYDYGRTSDGVFYYAMEYLEGADLEGMVAVGGPQSPARVIHLVRQICGSLDEAHRRGMVHRDIKPANVFLCRGRSEPDTVKVLDFGLAKDMRAAEPALSAANMMLGTPLYMPPEAIKSHALIDARSDLYSLGAIAYMLLTGTPVFSGKTAIELCSKHLYDPPVAPSARLGRDVPADLEDIVMACLAKAPEGRPQTAMSLREMLDGCEDARSWKAADVDAWWVEHEAALEARRVASTVSPAPSVVQVDITRDDRAPRGEPSALGV
jgi:hypothetical protein